MKNIIFKIDGAHVMPDIKRNGEIYTLPDTNYDYKFGMLHKRMLWASKDAKEWCLAFRVVIDNVGYGIAELDQLEWAPDDSSL